MGAYSFESQIADLSNRYNQDNAANEYGRFVSQQRFGRQRADMNRGYLSQFPKFTGAWAGRLGSGIKSGVFHQALTDNVNGFNRNMSDLDTSEATTLGGMDALTAQRQAAYQRSLLAAQEDYARSQASQDPYAAYRGVY
jgi:hypothetical protein